MLTVLVSLNLLFYVMVTALALVLQVAIVTKANLLALDIAVISVVIVVCPFVHYFR